MAIDATTFEALRPRMMSVAYRMLGSATEAEDVVQDAFLRAHAVQPDDVRSYEAFLARVVINLCLDRLRSARARLESYVGPWLPEPIATEDGALGPLDTVELREQVSLAFLLLLQRLSPLERAVFVLREAFNYGHEDIAELLGISVGNARQLLHRAREHVAAERPRFAASPERHAELTGRFLQAVVDGELEPIIRSLADDAAVWSDGGGKVSAARIPILGPDRVARFFLRLARRYPDVPFVPVELNGSPGLVGLHLDGSVRHTVDAEFHADGSLCAVRMVLNPDKLAFLDRQLRARS